MAHFQKCWTIPLTHLTLKSEQLKPGNLFFPVNLTWKHELVTDTSDWLRQHCLLRENDYITFYKLFKSFSSEGILRKPEELALLINSVTSFSLFWRKKLLSQCSIDHPACLGCRLFTLKHNSLKGLARFLYCSVKQYDISICTWCHSQLFASLLVNSRFRSICGPKMKWVKAPHNNSMQMKQTGAAFYCCSNAWAFCAVAILEEGNFRSNNESRGFSLSTFIVGGTGFMLMGCRWIM